MTSQGVSQMLPVAEWRLSVSSSHVDIGWAGLWYPGNFFHLTTDRINYVTNNWGYIYIYYFFFSPPILGQSADILFWTSLEGFVCMTISNSLECKIIQCKLNISFGRYSLTAHSRELGIRIKCYPREKCISAKDLFSTLVEKDGEWRK